MREIKNDMELRKASIQDIKFAGAEKSDAKMESNAAPSKEIKDFSNPAAEALGRSQVSTTDNIKKDVAFGLSHPEAISSSDRFFDMTYNTLVAQGHPNAYEEAAAQATAYGREFA